MVVGVFMSRRFGLVKAIGVGMLLAAALFVAGFSAVFVALGVTASGLGLLLAQNGRLLELVGGVFIVAMGLVTGAAAAASAK